MYNVWMLVARGEWVLAAAVRKHTLHRLLMLCQNPCIIATVKKNRGLKTPRPSQKPQLGLTQRSFSSTTTAPKAKTAVHLEQDRDANLPHMQKDFFWRRLRV
ncbi:hypothetical protein M378DRAFT_171929 [Amanita muscaria Koide BX008]|uniref:Uncharacterized protein n=1 Tax=Amanita muscaria (strain Koide BX008) TaxID=946122 RepID=A0A0C2W7X6_AMAMK|nr:hypothetical protein M378DRAFT_171929 [Amanita muscaria Koide BX008]